MKTELPPTPTSTMILSIFLLLPPPKLLFTWCLEFHIVLKCLFQPPPPLSIPFYYFWKAYPRFAYGNRGKEHSLWGQKAQPLHRPAYKLEQRKTGIARPPPKGGELG